MNVSINPSTFEDRLNEAIDRQKLAPGQQNELLLYRKVLENIYQIAYENGYNNGVLAGIVLEQPLVREFIETRPAYAK